MSIGTDVTLIGISCHLKSYRISFAMNEALGFEFNRMEDFEIPGQGSGEMLNFPFFVYDHDEWKNHFCLVANHHPQGKLLPGLKQVDYFLMAKNPIDEISRREFMGKLRMIAEPTVYLIVIRQDLADSLIDECRSDIPFRRCA